MAHAFALFRWPAAIGVVDFSAIVWRAVIGAALDRLLSNGTAMQPTRSSSQVGSTKLESARFESSQDETSRDEPKTSRAANSNES